VGLVPTMGWLHDGHRALMARARAENATTVATIFVNPRQFGDPADLERYPRNEARDVSTCEAEGIDLVFAPPVEEVYPAGFDTVVSVGAIAAPLEGAARPGHFDGVATVVAILFGLIRADRAYFGQKDAQQVAVIRRMAIDLAIPTEVIACPTVREPDGLAMSSRNVHLSAAGRAAAPVLRRALLAARAAWEGGERSADALRAHMHAVLATEPTPGRRAYLCAFESAAGERSWLVVDDGGEAVRERPDIRDAVWIAALCEIAEESAAGGDLDELLSQLVALRLTESPEGIDEAEEAVRALQRVVGVPPQLASPARLDEIGAATRRLEQALDPAAPSPFTAALKTAPGTIDALLTEVEQTYRVPLRP